MTTPRDPARARPVGITKGPGETIHEYTFISRDEQRLLKNGEYVYYVLDDSEKTAESAEIAPNGHGPRARTERRVLGRILNRVPVQLYPDTFLSEPEVAPSSASSALGAAHAAVARRNARAARRSM